MDDRLAARARTPRYTFAEAAPLVGRPGNTVRRWSIGNPRHRAGQAVRDEPLIQIDGEQGPRKRALSFLNLLELQILSQYRDDDASLQAIRGALRYAAQRLDVERPLLSVRFRVRGGELFHRYAETDDGRLLVINASRGGQGTLGQLGQLVEGVTAGIDYQDDLAHGWWFLGRNVPLLVDTRVAGGRPITAHTGVRLDAITSRLREGLSPAEVADDTGADLAEVDAVRAVA